MYKYIVLWSSFNFIFCDLKKKQKDGKKNVVWIIEFFKVLTGTKVSYHFEVVCWLDKTPWEKNF